MQGYLLILLQHDNLANKIITYWYVKIITATTPPPPPDALYISVPCSLQSHSRVLQSLIYTSPSPTPVNVCLITVPVWQVFFHHRTAFSLALSKMNFMTWKNSGTFGILNQISQDTRTELFKTKSQDCPTKVKRIPTRAPVWRAAEPFLAWTWSYLEGWQLDRPMQFHLLPMVTSGMP